MKGRPSSQFGSALLLVLWALLLLSAAVFAWTACIQSDISRHAIDNLSFEAATMARSGIAISLNPAVTRQTPIPDEELAPGMGFSVRVTSEGGKLNINWLLRGEEPMKLTILKQWLERKGLDFAQREAFVDCLLDYVDADDVKRLNGAEDEGDYHPANRELRSVDELVRVKGSGPLISQPGWQDDLTVYSQGPIDLSGASAEILSLLPGLGETRIRQFVQYRQGSDGLDGTPDDKVFANLEEIQKFLGLSAAQFNSLNGLITYNDPTVRIISEGRSGNLTRQIIVVARKGNMKPQILSWKE